MITMTMKYSTILAVLCVLFFSAGAQQKPYNLKIGDKVPAILIPKVINERKVSLNTSEFKDRLLIIDFWNTMCKACIEALPKMDTLQKQFGSRVKILPVTYEPESLIRTFMQRNKLVKGLKIPSVVGDKVLSAWFKHLADPHEVWIYKGKVIAITAGEFVDARNIQTVLDGKTLYLPVKDDFYKFDATKPFLSLNVVHGNPTSSLAYTAVTGYQEGAMPSFKAIKDSITGLYRNYFTNSTILGAYNTFWRPLVTVNYIQSAGMPDAGGISPNQVVLEVKDKGRYIYGRGADYQENWHRKNDISYEWISVDSIAELKVKNKLIIGDLDRLLGLNGRWEKRQMKCLVLVRTDTVDRIKFSSGERVFEYQGKIKKLRDFPPSNLVYYLNSFPENPPIFDGTNYLGNVDLELNFNSWTDIDAIRKALQPYGLDLREESRQMDMFVLTERGWKKKD